MFVLITSSHPHKKFGYSASWDQLLWFMHLMIENNILAAHGHTHPTMEGRGYLCPCSGCLAIHEMLVSSSTGGSYTKHGYNFFIPLKNILKAKSYNSNCRGNTICHFSKVLLLCLRNSPSNSG